MRRMGGIWKAIPITYVMFWVGSLALAGVYPFAGYFSKDAILEAAWASDTAVGIYGFWCTLIAAFLTAFYSWRLIIMTFHGKRRAVGPSNTEHADHPQGKDAHGKAGHGQSAHGHAAVQESPLVMTGPLILLALGALCAGFVFRDQLIGANWQAFWGKSISIAANNHVLANLEDVPGWVSLSPTVAGLLGIALAYVFYMFVPSLPGRMARTFAPIYRLWLNKYYFDEMYNAAFVQPAIALARGFWHVGDETIIDGVPNGIAALTADGSAQVVKIQTGSIAVYAFTMLIGVVCLVAIYMLFR